MTNLATKLPSDVDRHVGARVRMRRQLLGMSQSALADQLGVSFQQVQKYEKGTNRIGASRLAQIAGALGVEVGFFYEGASQEPGGTAAADETAGSLGEFLAIPDALRLVKAYAAIGEPALRERIVELAETLAETRSGRGRRGAMA